MGPAMLGPFLFLLRTSYHSIDDVGSCGYSCPSTILIKNMAVKSIQLGQVWRKDETGETFLVTKLYNEVFAQYAMLRPAKSTAASDTVRLKVQRTGEGVTLPGYTFTQDASEF